MKKRIVGIITAMTMLISAMPQVIVSAADDITISNLSELEAFRDDVNNGNTYEGRAVALTSNIDMSDKYGEGKELWESIGTEEHPFNGSFAGAGHSINVCIDTGDTVGIIGGLFGYADENAVIENLAVSGSVRVIGTIFMGGWHGVPGYVGAIVGNNKGVIKNCSNTADVTYTGNNGFTGGIAGKTEGSIINCYNTGNIKIMSSSGSNISETDDNSLIQNCFYLSETEMSDGKGAHGKMEDQFMSGEVAYLLGGEWGQKIGVDKYPVIGGDKVYFSGGGYTNNPVTYPYKITALKITDTNGEPIEHVREKTGFIVEADIIKTEERNEKDYLFVAVYDTDNVLISLDYVKAKFAVDGECSFGFSIPPQEKTVGNVKVFVWNTFSSAEPLAEAQTLYIPLE